MPRKKINEKLRLSKVVSFTSFSLEKTDPLKLAEKKIYQFLVDQKLTSEKHNLEIVHILNVVYESSKNRCILKGKESNILLSQWADALHDLKKLNDKIDKEILLNNLRTRDSDEELKKNLENLYHSTKKLFPSACTLRKEIIKVGKRRGAPKKSEKIDNLREELISASIFHILDAIFKNNVELVTIKAETKKQLLLLLSEVIIKFLNSKKEYAKLIETTHKEVTSVFNTISSPKNVK